MSLVTGGRNSNRYARRTAGAAIAVLVLVSVPAAAVTGVFTPQRESDGLVRLSDRQVVATGETNDGRRWRLLASQSDVGFCLGLDLPSEAGAGSGLSEGCGGARPGTLDAATTSGGSTPQNALVHGMAPDAAARVRVSTGGGVSVTVDTVDDDAGLAGRFYLTELPVRRKLGPTRVQALDQGGSVISTVEAPIPG